MTTFKISWPLFCVMFTDIYRSQMFTSNGGFVVPLFTDRQHCNDFIETGLLDCVAMQFTKVSDMKRVLTNIPGHSLDDLNAPVFIIVDPISPAEISGHSIPRIDFLASTSHMKDSQ